MFKVAGHARQTVVVLSLILWLDGSGLKSLDPLALSVDLLQLFLSVLDEDLAGLLETLVGQLLEGNLG